jgi:hypothetical protein
LELSSLFAIFEILLNSFNVFGFDAHLLEFLGETFYADGGVPETIWSVVISLLSLKASDNWKHFCSRNRTVSLFYWKMSGMS